MLLVGTLPPNKTYLGGTVSTNEPCQGDGGGILLGAVSSLKENENLYYDSVIIALNNYVIFLDKRPPQT